MMNQTEKHKQHFPTARGIRRSCSRELYRAAKRLKTYIPPERMAEAEKLYLHKVMQNLPYIVANGSNHKALADWWDENVNAEVAAIWNVEPEKLARAFRDAFGG
jgi:toxin CptA